MEDAEVIETNNNHSTMSDNFSWSISKPDLGLTKITKSFAVLCEPEGEAFEGRDCKQAPTSRWVVNYEYFDVSEKKEHRKVERNSEPISRVYWSDDFLPENKRTEK